MQKQAALHGSSSRTFHMGLVIRSFLMSLYEVRSDADVTFARGIRNVRRAQGIHVPRRVQCVHLQCVLVNDDARGTHLTSILHIRFGHVLVGQALEVVEEHGRSVLRVIDLEHEACDDRNAAPGFLDVSLFRCR